jgi:hypothetical protein
LVASGHDNRICREAGSQGPGPAIPQDQCDLPSVIPDETNSVASRVWSSIRTTFIWTLGPEPTPFKLSRVQLRPSGDHHPPARLLQRTCNATRCI